MNIVKKFKRKIRSISFLGGELGNIDKERGMTYVELIVVLSIFSVMTSIILFNYGQFQENVDIKILANDIASKVVEAQDSAVSGVLNTSALSGWKPQYGMYFDLSSNKTFTYFADTNSNSSYDPSVDPILDQITITKGNYISGVDSFLGPASTPISSPLSISFKRPDASAIFSSGGSILTGFDYIQVTVSSSGSNPVKAYIRVYPSGRIQVN